MNYLLQHWGFLVHLSLCTALFGFAITLLVRELRVSEKRMKENTNTATNVESTLVPMVLPTPPLKMKEAVVKAMRTTVILFLGAALGYGGSRVEFAANRYYYQDVMVVERFDATHFTLQPARMAAWDITTCTAPGWERGQKMKYLMFQYHVKCDSVDGRGAFEFYTHNGVPIIYSQESINAQVVR